MGTAAFGGGGVTVWRYFSLNCKIDLYVLDGTLAGQKYRVEILRPLVVCLILMVIHEQVDQF